MKFCHEPFKVAEIDPEGNVRLCCDSWHTQIVGNVLDTPLDRVWSGEAAQDVRRSIMDQSYRYCRADRCPVLQADGLTTLYPRVTTLLPQVLKYSFDPSCNLHCPSCRATRVQHRPGTRLYSRAHTILHTIEQTYAQVAPQLRVQVTVTGSGDPFGSDLYRTWLEQIDPTVLPHRQFHLLTNGVLCTPRQINRILHLHHQIASITVSIDAATESTYTRIRRGGVWSLVQENLHHLCTLTSLSHARIKVAFVIQQQNIDELEQFIETHLANQRIDTVHLSRLLPWEGMALDYASNDPFLNNTDYLAELQAKYTSARIDWFNCPRATK